LALKCLKKAKSLNANDADLFKSVVDFYKLLESTVDLPPQIKKLLDSETLLQGKSLPDYIKSWTMNAKTVYELWMSWYVLENFGMKDQSLEFIGQINATTPGMSHEVYLFIKFLDFIIDFKFSGKISSVI
jgi:hypothetical protein